MTELKESTDTVGRGRFLLYMLVRDEHYAQSLETKAVWGRSGVK